MTGDRFRDRLNGIHRYAPRTTPTQSLLLEDSISIFEDKRHVRVQLIRNDIQIVRSFQGVFYPTTGPRDTHENVPQSIIPPPTTCV
ncbi:hypothetical protein AVEN_154083-1 [Araneus ventricosus]|uniref:Uncharacterized protein n=1 Tax=Araneus ventricosus TaxID=182803 RepID=A0A4Y2J3T2_ARAVE|nr:hypothetical protein AVEN_154083-1 [Araneus ventricosus]